MNTKRIVFWSGFVIILALIIWGLAVAANKPMGPAVGTPPPVTADDHIRGPVNAPVTLLEYGDFQCPACGEYYPLIEKLLSEASSTVRLVFRNFPLSQHPNAIPAAIAAEAASNQGQFWGMFDLLYQNQADWSDLPDPTSVFEGYATKLGLNLATFEKDIKDPALAAKIQTDITDGTTLGINYTPSLFVNGTLINNPSTYDQFKALVLAAATTTAQ